jgi:PilZ domain
MPRKDARHPTYAEGKIIFGPGEEMRCTIRDISPSGAKLKLPFAEWLPPRFELEDSKGVRRHVVLAWQGSEYIGVRYTDRAPRRQGPQFGRRGR